MNNPYPMSETPPTVNVGMIMLVVRLFVIVVGLGITLFGIKYSLDIFLTLYAYLQQPETLAPLLERWINVLNIKDMIDIYPAADKVLVMIILATGVLLLLRITLGLIHAGVKILINSTSIGSLNNGGVAKKVMNLDSKLHKLKYMADQGLISKKAYEEARDKYLIEKVIDD